MKLESDTDTLEIAPATSTPDTSPPPPFSSLVELDVAAQTDKGKVRESNEDNFLVARGGRSMEVMLSSVPEQLPLSSDEIAYAMVVADGMGGAAAGEVASSTALSALLSLVLNTPDWILRINEPMAMEIMARIHDRFLEVNTIVSERAKSTPGLAGMGTTLTVVWSIGNDLFVGHVGDSRAYLFRDGKLNRLTKDQTLAQELIDGGMIQPEDAVVRQYKHVLTQAIGTHVGSLHPEVHRTRLQDDDRVLLCSDGLNEMVDDLTISALLKKHESSADACQALVGLALENGGTDNITVLVGRYRLPKGS